MKREGKEIREEIENERKGKKIKGREIGEERKCEVIRGEEREENEVRGQEVGEGDIE